MHAVDLSFRNFVVRTFQNRIFP